MTKVKICGITNKTDAINASKLGADMLGFVFYEKSKRYVDPATVAAIVKELPPFIARVGVFADAEEGEIIDAASSAGIDIIQLHGGESPELCDRLRSKYRIMKAFRLKNKKDLRKIKDYDVDFYMMDTYVPDVIGGTGEAFDWAILRGFELSKPMVISGGLTPANVIRAIKEMEPYAVDVSSGVESSPGKKDAKLMKYFMDNIKKVRGS